MMAYKVLDNIFFGHEVPLYHAGQMHRDWTFVSDIVQGVVKAVDRPLGYEVLNLGRGEPVALAQFVQVIEECVGQKAHGRFMPLCRKPTSFRPVPIFPRLETLLDYHPQVSLPEGISQFCAWYRQTRAGPMKTAALPVRANSCHSGCVMIE